MYILYIEQDFWVYWGNGVRFNVARCEHEFSKHSVGAIGAPCISHSKTSPLGFSMFSFSTTCRGPFLNHCLCHGLLNHPKLRMGKKDGFNNELTKKLHDISTAVIPKTKMSVHENVPEYGEDAYLVAETGFQIQQALFPGKALLKYLCLFSVTMLYSGVLYEFKK